MKVKVQTKGGNHEFESGADENLLFAGLRNGLTLPYECATGTCGTCRARVLEGDVELNWTEAPGLSYVNQEKREILLCQAKAQGECTLRIPAKVTHQNEVGKTPGDRSGIIENVSVLTRDVVSFDVVLDAPLTFSAGQFAVLEVADVIGRRAYSMINYQPDTKVLEFVVKRKPNGRFSDWLFDADPQGALAKVFGPLGAATFHPEEDKNILCIAGGSGIAGMMSIITQGCGDGYFSNHKGHVFFGVRTAEDVFFLDEFSAFVEAYPNKLEVTVALSDEDISVDLIAAYPRINFATGFVHSVTSESMAGKYENILAYVAGPPPMVDGALRMLVLEARLPGTNIRYDKFG